VGAEALRVRPAGRSDSGGGARRLAVIAEELLGGGAFSGGGAGARGPTDRPAERAAQRRVQSPPLHEPPLPSAALLPPASNRQHPTHCDSARVNKVGARTARFLFRHFSIPANFNLTFELRILLAASTHVLRMKNVAFPKKKLHLCEQYILR
jgi:hypothetical protein